METTMTTQTEYGFWRKPRFDMIDLVGFLVFSSIVQVLLSC